MKSSSKQSRPKSSSGFRSRSDTQPPPSPGPIASTSHQTASGKTTPGTPKPPQPFPIVLEPHEADNGGTLKGRGKGGASSQSEDNHRSPSREPSDSGGRRRIKRSMTQQLQSFASEIKTTWDKWTFAAFSGRDSPRLESSAGGQSSADKGKEPARTSTQASRQTIRVSKSLTSLRPSRGTEEIQKTTQQLPPPPPLPLEPISYRSPSEVRRQTMIIAAGSTNRLKRVASLFGMESRQQRIVNDMIIATQQPLWKPEDSHASTIYTIKPKKE